jgi:hypothetical protein
MVMLFSLRPRVMVLWDLGCLEWQQKIYISGIAYY